MNSGCAQNELEESKWGGAVRRFSGQSRGLVMGAQTKRSAVDRGGGDRLEMCWGGSGDGLCPLIGWMQGSNIRKSPG